MTIRPAVPDRCRRLFLPSVLLILSLCLALPPHELAAQWPTDRGTPEQTGTATSGASISPPISRLGLYRSIGMNGARPQLLVDSSHVYMLAMDKISVFDLPNRLDTEGEFEYPDPVWEYVPERDEDVFLFRFVEPRAALADSMIVFIESGFSNDRGGFAELVGLNRSTGEELWRLDLGVVPSNPVMVAVGSNIFVRYEQHESNELPAMIVKTRPGESGFTASAESVDPIGFYGFVAGGGRVYTPENDKMTAYRQSDLQKLWSFPPETGDDLSARYGAPKDMMVAGGDLIILHREALISLDAAGNLHWATPFEEELQCFGDPFIALDGSTIVVSGLCGDLILGFDRSTGEELWRTDAPEQIQGVPSVVSEGVVYTSEVAARSSNEMGIRSYDTETGEALHYVRLSSGAPAVRMAVARGYLYTHAYGAEGPADGSTLAVFEAQPAEVDVAFDNPERFECGAYAQPITIRLNVTNLGPGPSRRTNISVQAIGLPVSWAVIEPQDPGTFIGDTLVTIPVGNIEPLGFREVVLELTPRAAGEVILTARASSPVRQPNPEAGNDEITFEVHGPVPADLDIAISAVEVTQGIQDMNDTVSLVAGKQTLVRVYTDSTAEMDAVRAVMYVSGRTNLRASSRLFDRERVLPIESCQMVPEGAADRSTLSSTFNFSLPPEMLEGVPDGPFEVEIVIDPANMLGESNRANNVYTGEIAFESLPPICMKTYAVRTTAQNGGNLIPSTVIPESLLSRALAMLPTRELRVFPQRNVLEELQFFEWGPYELDPGGDMDDWKIMTTLWTHDVTSRNPASCNREDARTIYTGIVGENNRTTHPEGNQFNGMARLGADQMFFRIRDLDGPAPFRPAGGVTLAHELGHNYDRRHVNCGDPAGPDPNYPHHVCQLGPVSDDAYFGMDLLDPRSPIVIAPRPASASTQLGDLLSYAANRWPSDYTWRAVQSELRRQLKSAPHTERGPAHAWVERWKQNAEKMIVVSAAVWPDGRAEIADVLPVSSNVVPDGKKTRLAESALRATRQVSPYILETVDGDGAVIDSVQVELERLDDSEEEIFAAGGLLPFNENIAALRLKDDTGDVAAERERSPNAPEVTLLQPQAGLVAGDIIPVEWNATDADDDPLATLIQYSYDDGQTWETIVTNAPDESYQIDATLLHGAIATARVRVIVSDGFNATEAVSSAFTVELREPIAMIVRPENTATFQVGQPILAEGFGFDPEDGALDEDLLTWELNGTGDAGMGRSILLTGLPVGQHVLVLTATDGDGNTAEDAIALTITPRGATSGNALAVILGITEASDALDYDRNNDGLLDIADLVGVD